MVSLIRSGPKTLMFESSKIDELKACLKKEMCAKEYDFSTAFGSAGEDCTIVFLTEKIVDVVETKDIKEILVIMDEPEVIICKLLSSNDRNLISKARTAPRFILLRAIGDIEKVIEEIGKDFNCSTGDFADIFDKHNEKGTIIYITDKPINREIRLQDIYEKTIYIEEKFYSVFRVMRMQALKYLNAGIGNKDWYELEIRIYDRYSKYKLHYERLAKVLDSLQLGLILGESWGKDYPRLLLSVDIYRVRFFTFYEPEYIKKILVGLEHLDDGTRIVDYDLYFNRKKLYWSDASDYKIRERAELSQKYRKEIFSRLSEGEITEILRQEQEILKTRY